MPYLSCCLPSPHSRLQGSKLWLEKAVAILANISPAWCAHAARWQVPYKFHPEVTLGNAVAGEFGWRNHRVFVWVGVSHHFASRPSQCARQSFTACMSAFVRAQQPWYLMHSLRKPYRTCVLPRPACRHALYLSHPSVLQCPDPWTAKKGPARRACRGRVHLSCPSLPCRSLWPAPGSAS